MGEDSAGRGGDGPDQSDLQTLASLMERYAAIKDLDPAESLPLMQALRPDLERVLGPDSPVALALRHDIARTTAWTGDPTAAMPLFQELLIDQDVLLGSHHPNTILVGFEIASLMRQAKNGAGLRQLQSLLPEMVGILGPDADYTLLARIEIATATAETGNTQEALRLLRDLVPDLSRVHGPDHGLTLDCRSLIACLTAVAGDPADMLPLLQQLLPDEERVLGPAHPRTVQTRDLIDTLTEPETARQARAT